MVTFKRSMVPLLCAAAVSAGCGRNDGGGPEPIEISADELQRAFLDDDRAARRRFEGRDLVIEGEVARAEARFRGTTMEGEVEVPARIAFRSAFDSLPGGLDQVEVEGRFDAPEALDPWSLDPRIRVGETVRVSCEGAELRWSDPGLYVSECRLAGS
jgi:hypothetical protein